MIGVLAGAVLIVFGVVPGLFCRRPSSRFHPVCPESFPRPRWLAGLGAALIVATVLAYLPR
jgi:hypothetical protein